MCFDLENNIIHLILFKDNISNMPVGTCLGEVQMDSGK